MSMSRISKFTSICTCITFFNFLGASDLQNNEFKVDLPQTLAQTQFAPFTGKINKNRVRLRLQPDLASNVLKEFSKNDLVIVTDQHDDFYSILPSQEAKGYIFRTYVLDGHIEGSHVNVRLAPDMQAPVLCQLNSGEKVDGKVCSHNNKWLEIPLPESVRFYVAKEFITKIGDEHTFYQLEKQRKQTAEKLSQLELALQEELKKPFHEIHLTTIATELNSIIAKSKDFPQQVEKAEHLLKNMQEAYLKKSISTKSMTSLAVKDAKKTKQTPENTKEEEPETHALLNNITLSQISCPQPDAGGRGPSGIDLSTQEEKQPIHLKGIVKPYLRHVKNAPGDFILVDPTTNLPIAFLCSTKIDLAKLVDKEATLLVMEKPNNNFAYPAYFALANE